VTGGRLSRAGYLGAFITKVKRGSIADTMGRLRTGELDPVKYIVLLFVDICCLYNYFERTGNSRLLVAIAYVLMIEFTVA